MAKQFKSKRIQKLIDLVPGKCELVWDLCCDHGFIGEGVLRQYPQKQVYFLDQVPNIMSNLTSRLKATDIPKARYRLITQSALSQNFESSKKSFFILAGVGGVLGIKILEQISKTIKPEDKVLVSIHKNQLEVREYLINSQYELYSEYLIEEGGQFYEMLIVGLNGVKPISPYGNQIWNESGKTGFRYLESLLKLYGIKAKHQAGTYKDIEAELVQIKFNHFSKK